MNKNICSYVNICVCKHFEILIDREVILMNRGIIFDFDGVVINSSEIQKEAFEGSYKLIVGEGEPPFDEFLMHSGDSLENILTSMELPLEMVEPYKKISRERSGDIKTYDGIKELLMFLKEKGYVCGLCTGKDRERTMELLKKLRLSVYFDSVVCSDDVNNPKPKPDSLIMSLHNLNISIDNAIMIGDSCNDIICAKSVGVTSVAVTWADTKEKILQQVYPDYIVNTAEELLYLITNIC